MNAVHKKFTILTVGIFLLGGILTQFSSNNSQFEVKASTIQTTTIDLVTDFPSTGVTSTTNTLRSGSKSISSNTINFSANYFADSDASLRGNQTSSIANFYMYNENSFPGAIKKITISRSSGTGELNTDNASRNLILLSTDSSLADTFTGGQVIDEYNPSGARVTTINWTISANNIYFFKIYNIHTFGTFIARNTISITYDTAFPPSSEIAVTDVLVDLGFSTIGEGATTQATATILPGNATNKNVTWTSSDTNVATVNSSGVVTAISEGEAIITATAQDGSGQSGFATITVTPPILVTGIVISIANPNIIKGSTTQATATVEPPNANNLTVDWESSDEAVATISSTGLITAVGPGTTVIKATAQDGSNIFGTANLTVRGPSTTVIINEVYGGGGNTGAPYTHDFIELYNLSNTPIDLSGYSIQYTSATGTTWTNITDLSGNIPAFGYYLIQQAGGATGDALPSPDASGSIAMSATAGKVALVNTTTALTGANPINDLTVIDFVGFGATANAFEGSGPTPAPSNTTSISRSSKLDTNSNNTDFTAGAPTPKNSLQGFTEQFLSLTQNKENLCTADDLQWNFLTNNYNSLTSSNQTAFFNPGSYALGMDALERYQYLISVVDSLPSFSGQNFISGWILKPNDKVIEQSNFNVIGILLIGIASLFIVKKIKNQFIH
jgi:uncharacterized protein YjdB